MKRILCAGVALLFLFPSAASAAWDKPQTGSPYSLSIIPVREKTDIFGCKSLERDFGTAAAGDTVRFVLRVEVPESPSPAQLRLEGVNATLNSALTAALPDSPGLYYYKADGTFSADMHPLSAYCTGTPAITASIRGTEQITGAGGYALTRASDGYIFAANGRGMEFYPDAQGRVYASCVFAPGYKHRLTAALLAEDGEAAAVARGVLRALSMDEAQLLAGGVYMSEAMLTARFGAGVEARSTYAWPALPAAQPGIPTYPVAGVPETGFADELLMCALILLLGAMMLYDRRRLR